LEGVACPDLFCLLVLTAVLPAFGLLTDLTGPTPPPPWPPSRPPARRGSTVIAPDLWLAAEVRDDDRAQLAEAATHTMRVPPAGGG
jgi:hypothetical protein